MRHGRVGPGDLTFSGSCKLCCTGRRGRGRSSRDLLVGLRSVRENVLVSQKIGGEPDRDRRRRARRRQRRGDAARGGLPGPSHAHRPRTGDPVRPPAAVQDVPALGGGARRLVCQAAGWYDEHDVERLESSVVAVDRCRRARGRPRLGPGARVPEGPDSDGRTEPATGGSGSRAAGDPLPADGRRVRRDQAGGGRESARGGRGDGVHRLRGGRLPDAARGSGDGDISRAERRWRRVLGERGRRSVRRDPPRERRRAAQPEIRSPGSKGPSGWRRS